MIKCSCFSEKSYIINFYKIIIDNLILLCYNVFEVKGKDINFLTRTKLIINYKYKGEIK